MATTGEPFGLFWDSQNGDRTYSAASFEYWLKKFFTSGVFNGDMQVKATSGMTLEIEPGYANVDGKVKFWNGAFNLTLNPANSTYPRIDTIVITRDNVNREITCEVVTGSYSADTPQPTAPIRNAEIYQLVLAQIYVGAGVTEITQSSITDTRPDNSLCGWITGTVTQLDFSQFTAQFEAYFAEFKADAEGDYAAWFNNVQQEQIEDKEAWDAWYAALQEELHELPPDSAEYLQVEIDELKESGLSGSIFKITTINSSLEGKSVSITNADGTEVKTGTFDSNLECMIYGMKSVGELTITSTDGIQTATSVISIPYFGNYVVPIAFWAATVNIQGDENLYGATITVKDSDNLTVGTVTLSAIDGTGTFIATKADTYTFNFTYQSVAYSQELAVTQETTYSISLSAGFNWQTWVDTARFLDSSDYANLGEVLADEEAVRELCLEHNCVDYLCDISSVSNDVETIINNDLFAKWVNNSDYALDNMIANEAIKDAMDEANKYEYGEWVIIDDTTTPATWGAKGNIPVMTSNSAPYGEAFADSNGQYSNGIFAAFDGNDATMWLSNHTVSGGATATGYIGYKSANPICVKRIYLGNPSPDSYINDSVSLYGSNDGSTYEQIDITKSNVAWGYVDFDNDKYYLYHKVSITQHFSTSTQAMMPAVGTLQFYGRELSVSVPKMDTNTTPYGEAFADNEAPLRPAYKAFDGGTAEENTWFTTGLKESLTNKGIGYTFTNKMIPKMAVLKFYNSGSLISTVSYKFQGYNGTTWEDLSVSITDKTGTICVFDNTSEYDTIRLFLVSQNMNNSNVDTGSVSTLQFYGLDYSEKEFEAGTNKKWLYDHGVELETLELRKGSHSGNVIEKLSASIICSLQSTPNSNGADRFAIVLSEQNFTPFSLLRAKQGDNYIEVDGKPYLEVCLSTRYPQGGSIVFQNTQLASCSLTSNNMPNNISIDITSITQSAYVGFGTGYNNGTKCELTELWLE